MTDVAKMIAGIEAERDAKHGAGRWHCDDLTDRDDTHEAVRAFLAHARALGRSS